MQRSGCHMETRNYESREKKHHNLAKALNVVKKMVKKKDELANNVWLKKRQFLCNRRWRFERKKFITYMKILIG